MRFEPDDVGVAPHDEVALGLGQRLPHGGALAVTVAVVGEHVGGRDHSRPRRGCDLGGPVARVVVDHDDLVDEAVAVDEVVLDRPDDGAHRRRLVARRKAHRDDMTVLGRSQLAEVEVGVDVGRQDRRDRSHAGTLPTTRNVTHRDGVRFDP